MVSNQQDYFAFKGQVLVIRPDGRFIAIEKKVSALSSIYAQSFTFSQDRTGPAYLPPAFPFP